VSSTLSLGSWTTTVSPEEIIGEDSSTGDLYIRRIVDITGVPQEFMRLNVW
jgi:hypothetical protein